MEEDIFSPSNRIFIDKMSFRKLYTFISHVWHISVKNRNSGFSFVSSNFLRYFSCWWTEEKLFSYVLKHMLWKNIHIHSLDLMFFSYWCVWYWNSTSECQISYSRATKLQIYFGFSKLWWGAGGRLRNFPKSSEKFSEIFLKKINVISARLCTDITILSKGENEKCGNFNPRFSYTR